MADYTIDLCEGGTASANSYSPEYESIPDKAFDNILGIPHENGWTVTATSGWLQYQFAETKQINKINMLSYFASGIESVDDFTIQASNTGSFSGEQTILYTGNNPPNTPTFVEHVFSNTNSYIYYRIDVTSVHTQPGNNPTHVGISEIEMMEEIVTNINPDRPDNITELYGIGSRGNLRGKAVEGFIRPTLKQFFTSKNFEEIESYIAPTIGDAKGAGYYFGTLNGYELICAPITGQSSKSWADTYNVAVFTPGADSLTNGYQNTLDMIADTASENHQAANFVVGLTIGGFTDWYLPAKDELNLLYLNRIALEAAGSGSFTEGYYWSSSQANNSFDAWRQALIGGWQHDGNKSTVGSIRAIRRIAI